MVGTGRQEEYTLDLWNYMYRGLLSHIFAAKAFGSETHVTALVQHKKRFESLMGKNYDDEEKTLPVTPRDALCAPVSSGVRPQETLHATRTVP